MDELQSSCKGTSLMDNPKDTASKEKPRISLIPPASLLAEAKAFKLGAEKYGHMNWRDIPVKLSVYLDAMQRHYCKILDGEWIDEESGAPHAAHIKACMSILIDARECGTLIDDRKLPPGKEPK